MKVQRYRNFSKFIQNVNLKNTLRKEYIKNHTLQASQVDIILPTFNRSHVLRQAIDSVKNQLHTNWKLYVCDDGSTDNTLEHCKLYEDNNKVYYCKLPHRGVSAARNHGLKCSNGEYICFLDSDNTWSPEYLSLMLTFMSIYSLDSAYCAARLIGDCDEQWLGDSFSWQQCVIKNYIDLNCFIIRSSNAKNLFDENLERFVDWDYILNSTRESRTSYLPVALVEYCNKKSRDRITTTVYQNNQRAKYIKSIQDKHLSLMGYRDNMDARTKKVIAENF